MSNGKRWTIPVCGNCDRPRNIAADEGGCANLAACRASLRRGEDTSLAILPVSTLEALAQELEERAEARSRDAGKLKRDRSRHRFEGASYAFEKAAQLVRAKIEGGK